MIHIGRYSVSQAIKSTVDFIRFKNAGSYTAIAAPNMVASGEFVHPLNRSELIKDARNNRDDDFPGVSVSLRTTMSKCTPGLHTRVPSKFIIPGCHDIHDLRLASEEISEIDGMYKVKSP